MRKSWISVSIAALVIVLIAILAAIQYRHQKQVSDDDREKLQNRVQESTNRFAEEFNREIQAVYFNFQMDADAWQRSEEFNERFDLWHSKAENPSVIKQFYFVSNDARLSVFDPAAKRFVPTEDAGLLTELRTRIAADKSERPFYGDQNALVLPIREAGRRIEHVMVKEHSANTVPVIELPKSIGDLIVILDRDALTTNILPFFVNKYFPDGEFRVSVMDENGGAVYGSTTGTDASAVLFDLSPDKFFMFSARDSLPRSMQPKVNETVVRRQSESRTTTIESIEPNKKTANTTFKVEVRKGGTGETHAQIFSGATGIPGTWLINVQHRDGSVMAFIDKAFWQDVALSGGLFGLLATAVLVIFFLAQKTRIYAQRQVDFVSSVTHEFRTPLAVIYSAGENLADGVAAEPDQIVRYGGLIKSEGRKLSAMVEQILEFAGANSGRHRYDLRPLAVAELVDDAIDECSHLLESEGFTVERDVQLGLPSVKGDRDAISRAIKNLLVNSIKYSNGSKWLRVSVTNGNRKVKISVEDKGIGISAADLRQIFEPFFRSRSVVDAQIHGNGLGLSLVKQITDAHSGKVSAESNLGKGSKFV
ncbi:MAG: HAMP domain-containing sensor histidine kinase, partial [Acidobacteriota bacterium]